MFTDYFDRWGVLEHCGPDDPEPGIKVFERDLIDPDLSFGAKVCGLWLRFQVCHGNMRDYTRAKLAEDLGVKSETVQKWLRELEDAGFLADFTHLWSSTANRSQVYFVQSVNGGPVKVGCAIDPAKRLGQLQTGYPEPLQIIAIIEQGGIELERQLHDKFSQLRIHGEWFSPDPELMAFITTVRSGKYLPGSL